MAITKNITVALATYNGSKYLEALLASINTQTMPPARLVIVDDCSTDNTIDIIKLFKPGNFKVDLYKNEKNIGVNKTFKKLTSLCNNGYIAFCDQDDIWQPQKLQTCFEALQKIDDGITPCVAFSDLALIGPTGELLQQSFWKIYGIKPATATFKQVLFGNVITGCTTLLNQAMAQELLKMPDKAILYDHWIALIAFSVGKNAPVNEALVLYRAHEDSVTVKAKVPLWKRLLSAEFRVNYLKAEIVQAAEFLRIYCKQLTPGLQKNATRFLALTNKPYAIKKVNTLITQKLKT